MSLSVFIRHRLANFSLDVSFESEGRLTALFGPSGCGKTSVVNVIAGLIRPDSAKVVADGVTLVDTAQGIFLPAHRRNIGYVFQDARLLPHLTVRQNLAYGRWFTPKERRFGEEASIVDLLGLAALLGRKPRQLSGGEMQRVALGRAILQSPRLLLMDEPLASLDEQRKQEVMPYIERLRDELKIPIIYVSHSAAEVARLATDVVLMASGHVIASDATQLIMPALERLDGTLGEEAGSLIDMQVGSYDRDNDLTQLMFSGGEARVAGRMRKGTVMRVHIRSADVMIATVKPASISALNVLRGRVATITTIDKSACVVTLRCGDDNIDARVTRYSVNKLGLKPGKPAFAIVKAMSVKTPTTRPQNRAQLADVKVNSLI